MPGDAKLEVVEAVREAIVKGEYAPSQRLIETDLCERFATSRFIARAALQELSARGLVEFQPNKGARVRNISLDEAIEITEVRMLLEAHVAARAAKRVTQAEAAQLRSIAADMRSAVARADVLAYIDLNTRLHGSIRDIAAHPTAARLLAQLRDQTVRHQFILALGPGRPAISLPQHELIVTAITGRDPAGAEQAMREHLQSVVDALQAIASGVTPDAVTAPVPPASALVSGSVG